MHDANCQAHIMIQCKSNIPSKSTKWNTSLPPQHFISLTFSAVFFSFGKFAISLSHFQYSVHLHFVCLYLTQSPCLPPSRVSFSVCLPFFPLALLFFSSPTCLSRAVVFRFTTWPVNYFPETLLALCLSQTVKHTLTHKQTHAHTRSLTHWHIQVYTCQQVGGAGWGGATVTHLTLWVCFPHTQTHKQK